MSDDEERSRTYGKGAAPSDRTAASARNDAYADRDENVDTEGIQTALPDTGDGESDADLDPPVADERVLSDDYYETGLTPEAPSEANIDRVERFVDLGDVEDIEEGAANKGSTYIGHTPDGDTMFVKESPNPYTAAGHEFVDVVNDAFDPDQLPEEHRPIVPEAGYDSERDAATAEDVGGEDTEPPMAHSFENGEVDAESYLNAWAFKAVTADWDVAGNIIARLDDEGESYEFAPVDFDFAGDEDVDPQHHDLDDVVSRIGSFGWGVEDESGVNLDAEDAKDRIREYADAIDEEQLERQRDEFQRRANADGIDSQTQERMEETVFRVENCLTVIEIAKRDR